MHWDWTYSTNLKQVTGKYTKPPLDCPILEVVLVTVAKCYNKPYLLYLAMAHLDCWFEMNACANSGRNFPSGQRHLR